MTQEWVCHSLVIYPGQGQKTVWMCSGSLEAQVSLGSIPQRLHVPSLKPTQPQEGICWGLGAVPSQLPRQHRFRPQLVNFRLGNADPACLDYAG